MAGKPKGSGGKGGKPKGGKAPKSGAKMPKGKPC